MTNPNNKSNRQTGNEEAEEEEEKGNKGGKSAAKKNAAAAAEEDDSASAAAAAVKWIPKDRLHSSRHRRRFSSGASVDEALGLREQSQQFSAAAAAHPLSSPRRGGGGGGGGGIRAIQAMRKEIRVKSPSDSDSDLLLASATGATIADPTFVAKHILLSRSHEKLHTLHHQQQQRQPSTAVSSTSSNDWNWSSASPRSSSAASTKRWRTTAAAASPSAGPTPSKTTTQRMGLAPISGAAVTGRRDLTAAATARDPFARKPLGRRSAENPNFVGKDARRESNELGVGGGGGGFNSAPGVPRSVTAKRREERETLLGTGLWESDSNVCKGRRGGKDWTGSGGKDWTAQPDEDDNDDEEPLEDPFKTEVNRLLQL